METNEEFLRKQLSPIIQFHADKDFTNFNLNQNHKYSDISSSNVQFCNKSNNGKHSGDTVTDNYERKSSWNKTTAKYSSLKTFKNSNSNSDINDEKERKSFSNNCSNEKNCSTLSLYISAYENSIEAALNETNEFPKKSNAFRPINSLTKFQDHLEFPRQMEESNESPSEPEIQQFKTCQKLFSPNQGASSSSSHLQPQLLKNMEEKFPVSDATLLFEMEDEINDESKEESNEKFRREIRTMLYAFGDVKNPNEATLDLLQSIIVEYVTNLSKIGQSLEPRKKLTLQAIHYMTQHDIRKFDRIRELLTMHEELKKAKKDFENPI